MYANSIFFAIFAVSVSFLAVIAKVTLVFPDSSFSLKSAVSTLYVKSSGKNFVLRSLKLLFSKTVAFVISLSLYDSSFNLNHLFVLRDSNTFTIVAALAVASYSISNEASSVNALVLSPATSS